MSIDVANEYPVLSELYAKALDLFQDRTRFTQGYYQRDKDGKECFWREGYSFCALGSLVYFGNGFSHHAQCCLQRVSEHLYGEVIQVVNDGEGGYEKVIKALEFAKELWTGYDPTEEELGMPVPKLLEKRQAK